LCFQFSFSAAVHPIARRRRVRAQTRPTGPSSTLQTPRTAFTSSIPEICSGASPGDIHDALGVGCYAVVGVEHALNAQLPILASIMIGVVTACGGGLLRDVLVRDEPLLFKPGQLYVLAALIGASLYSAPALLQNCRYVSGSIGNWLLVCFSHAGHRVQLENGFGVSQVGLAGKAGGKDVQVVASICATRLL
jgi:hypothetical protein